MTHYLLNLHYVTAEAHHVTNIHYLNFPFKLFLNYWMLMVTGGYPEKIPQNPWSFGNGTTESSSLTKSLVFSVERTQASGCGSSKSRSGKNREAQTPPPPHQLGPMCVYCTCVCVFLCVCKTHLLSACSHIVQLHHLFSKLLEAVSQVLFIGGILHTLQGFLHLWNTHTERDKMSINLIKNKTLVLFLSSSQSLGPLKYAGQPVITTETFFMRATKGLFFISVIVRFFFFFFGGTKQVFILP